MNDPLMNAIKNQQSGSKAVQSNTTEETKCSTILPTIVTIKRRESATKMQATSVFGSILISDIEGQNKTRTSEAVHKDNHPGLILLNNLWKDLSSLVYNKQSKPGRRDSQKTNIEANYLKIASLFIKMTQTYLPLEIAFPGGKVLPDDFILTALLTLHQTNSHAIASLSNTEIDSKIPPIDILLTNLKAINDFFFVLADLKYNIVFSDKYLLLLEEIVKLPFQFLCSKIQNNNQLLLSSQEQKRHLIAKYIYFSLQSIIVLSIFGEPLSLSKSKYEFILDRFKLIFGFLSQSISCEQIFREELEFESHFELCKFKYVLNSFAFKRLSILLQREKLDGQQPIEFSLKYVLVYYNYKILKIVIQRTQIGYNEHLLSALSALISRNSTTLNSLILQKDRENTMSVMLLLNENIYIIKTFVIILSYFSENLDPLQRQGKYDTIKEITFDCFSAALKLGLYKSPANREDAEKLSIKPPIDFLGLIFKSLLLFNKFLSKNHKYDKEISHYINVLIISIISRHVQTEDPICYNVYRLYMLQFIQSWDPKILIEKYSKYSEEMSRYLANFVEELKSDNEIIEVLNTSTQKIALEIYIQIAIFDCVPAIETAITLLTDSYNHDKKLKQCFYILTCIFLRKRIPQETFSTLFSWNIEQTRSIFGEIDCEKEASTFLGKDGMRILFQNYKKTILHYKQAKQELGKYQTNRKTLKRNSLNGLTEVDNYIYKEYTKTLENTVNSYINLMQMTSWFICTLHHISTIAEHFLHKTELANNFVEGVFTSKQGRTLMHDLLEILNDQSEIHDNKEDFIQKFVGFVISLLHPLEESNTKEPIKKVIVRHLIQLLTENTKQNVIFNALYVGFIGWRDFIP